MVKITTWAALPIGRATKTARLNVYALANDTGFAGAYKVRLDSTSGPYVQAFCIDLFLGINGGSQSTGVYNETLVMPTSNTLADMTRVSRAA